MNKRLRQVFLLAAVIVTAVVCFAFSAGALDATGQCGDDVYWNYDSETGQLVLSGSGDMWTYEDIYGPDPEDYFLSPFRWASGVKDVVISNGITNISPWVFAYAEGIESVSIPDSVSKIGYSAFLCCSGLKSITIPDSVTSIDMAAFAGCNSLEEVILSKNLTKISDETFGSCTSLEEIIIPEGITSIGKSAFYNCSALSSIDIPDGVTEIKEKAFLDCSRLKNITAPDSIRHIEKDVFKRTAYHYNTANWQDNVLYVDNCLVETRSGVPSSYSIKNGTVVIADNAFEGIGISNINIPDSVVSIGKEAFRSTSLQSITLPDSVTSIGDSLFFWCRSLKEATIPGTVSEIPEDTFYLCESLKSLTIKGGIERIGEYAFYGTGLERVALPDGITYIGKGAFQGCNELLSAILPSGLTVIEEHAFIGCSTLTDITIPFTVETIGSRAFEGCYNLENIYFIGSEAKWNQIAVEDGNENIDYATVYFDDTVCMHEITALMPATEPTCTTTGLTEGKYCSACNAVLIKQKIIPALGHAEETTPKKAPTCTQTGILSGKYCSVCGEILTAQTIIPAKGHSPVYSDYIAPTCTEDGLTVGVSCEVCGEIIKSQEKIPAKGHSYSDWITVSEATCGAKGKKIKICSCGDTKEADIPVKAHAYKETTTKATLTKNGKQITKCTVCGETTKNTTIYYPKTIKLAASAYTYNGKTKTPSVIVKDSKGNILEKDTDYTVKYASGRKIPGKYIVTVTFKGDYSGTKKLSFTIKPKAPSVTDIYSKTKGKAVVKWNNVTGESGYQLYYATSKNGTYKKVKSYETNKIAGSKTKLNSKKTYYFKVRAYKKTSSGTIYSSWSAVKSVKIK